MSKPPAPDATKPRTYREPGAVVIDIAGVTKLYRMGDETVHALRGVALRVHRNEYMGQNYGRVTAIGEDHIDLVELVSNGNGGWMERPASIALGEK